MGTKPRWSVTDDSTVQGDLRTLSMATPVVDAERLDKLIQFQRVFVERTGQVPPHAQKGAAWETWLARAHEEALAASGLEHKDLSRLSALCSDFCMKRRSEMELRRRRDAYAQKQDLDPEVLSELDKALERLTRSNGLTQRYGQQVIRLLEEREAELLSLHDQMWRQT